jgi:hypothetical protein
MGVSAMALFVSPMNTHVTSRHITSHHIASLTIFMGVSAMALFVSPMNSSSSAASSFSAACIDRFFRWKLPGEKKL